MSFKNIDTEGWRYFDELSRAEGWLITDLERELFLTDWQSFAWQLFDGEQCCGFVTAVPYQRTGWIGNLIVPPSLRGKGYGSTIFDFAVEQLDSAGISSIWLTASEEGAPLYLTRGFTPTDTIQRLILSPNNKGKIQREHFVEKGHSLVEIDSLNWQEDRSALLQRLISNNDVFAVGGSVAALQHCGDFQMIGPWHIGGHDDQLLLLQHILFRSDRSKGVILDVVSSSSLAAFLLGHKFVETGSTKLMVKGESSLPSQVGALASLGSVG